MTPYQQEEYKRMCMRNEQRVTLRRQIEVEEYYDGCKTGTRLYARDAVSKINEKWLADLDRRNEESLRFCSTSVPSRPVKPFKPGFFGVWGSFLRYCLDTLF